MSCIAVSSWGRTKAPPPKKLLSSVLNLHRASDRKCPDACRGSEAGVFAGPLRGHVLALHVGSGGILGRLERPSRRIPCRHLLARVRREPRRPVRPPRAGGLLRLRDPLLESGRSRA